MQLVVFSALLALASASPALLGSNKCTFGPSYWCSHVKHARECGAMQHCITAVWKYNIVPVKEDPKCEICVFAVTEARKFLKDNATKAQLTEFLEKGCALLPDEKLKKECDDMVKEYLPEILQLLSSELDPKAVCAAIGMCTAELTKDPESQPPITTTASQPDLCADCTKFIKDVETILNENQTVAQIEENLDVLCVHMGPLEDMCKKLVAQYVPLFLDMLSSEFNPGVICRILGLCKSGNIKDAMEFRLKFLELVKHIPMTNDINGPEECNICKTVMTEIQALDRDAKTQIEVENLLIQNICPLFGQMKTECEQLIHDYAPLVFEYLANELDPNVACKALHLCPAVQRPHRRITAVSVATPKLAVSIRKPLKKVRASTECLLCEFVLKELDSLLMENSTREEVTRALDAVCARLPDTIRVECKSFVDQYAPAVIALLVADLDPSQVCRTLGFCSRQVVQQAKLSPINDGACEVCKLVVQYIDSLLKDNATEQDIMDLLDKICNFLPDTLKTQCDNLIQEYGPTIAQLLAQLADPGKVCAELDLCTNSSSTPSQLRNLPPPVHTQQIKDNTLYFKQSGHTGQISVACLSGPEQWCKDKETASKCGDHALHYCRRHVWKS